MPLAFKLIDGLAMILIVGASLAGVGNVAGSGAKAVGWGQLSVVVAQLLYVLAGPALLWGWRSRAKWLTVVAWVWGVGVVWSSTAATVFHGGSDLQAAFPALVVSAVIAAVTGWWIHLRVKLSS